MKPKLLVHLLVIGLCDCGDRGSEPARGSVPPAVTLAPELDPSENKLPGHPGQVEFVFPDGHSEIKPARQVPDSIKFVDGKPVVKIVNTGQCILQLGVGGVELKSTLRAPDENRP